MHRPKHPLSVHVVLRQCLDRGDHSAPGERVVGVGGATTGGAVGVAGVGVANEGLIVGVVEAVGVVGRVTRITTKKTRTTTTIATRDLAIAITVTEGDAIDTSADNDTKRGQGLRHFVIAQLQCIT